MIYLIILLAIWEVYWTYTACWLAAKRGDKAWFLSFIIISLFGIPEILYVRKYQDSLKLEGKD
jgi:hypothetical protein